MKDFMYMLVFLVLFWMVLTDSNVSDLPSPDEVETTVSGALDDVGGVVDTVSEGIERVKAVNGVVSETVKLEMINPVAVKPDVAQTAFYTIDESGDLDLGIGYPLPYVGPYSPQEKRTCAQAKTLGGLQFLPEPYRALCGGE